MVLIAILALAFVLLAELDNDDSNWPPSGYV